MVTGGCSVTPSKFISSEVSSGIHYTEISNAEFARESRMLNDLTSYANLICETEHSIESKNFTARQNGKLPGTACLTLGCLHDVLLISTIKCDNEDNTFKIKLEQNHKWYESTEELNKFLDSNYNYWKNKTNHPAYTSLFSPLPERILENGTNMDIFVYKDSYMIIREDPRLLGSIIDLIQFRLGIPKFIK